MSTTGHAGQRLVADVGGTNTRLALFDEQAQRFDFLRSYRNRDFAQLEHLVLDWLGSIPAIPDRGCIAIAACLDGDGVNMVNMDWHFSRADFARATGIAQLGWVNDFVGNALALPYLEATDRLLLYPGSQRDCGKLAVLGPGTGLGGATLEPRGGDWQACACEPGHAGLAPASALELELFALLLGQYDNIYSELLVSGPGLQRLYRSLGEIHDRPVEDLGPEQISRLAITGADPLCREALSLFCALLGSTCGDFLLCSGALGGLYLTGGILPQISGFLQDSDFHSRLCSKGAMATVLEEVPVYLILREHPGLLGAAHAPLAA